MEVYTGRGIWKLMGVSSKMVVEATIIDGRNETSTFTVSRNFHRVPWKLPISSMEVNLLHSIYFHGTKSNSNLLPPWKLVEDSMEEVSLLPFISMEA